MGKLAYEQGSYGEYLLCLMKEHKFSSSEFAKLINVSRTYLYDLFPKDVFEYLYNNADEISMVRERMRYDNG